MQGNPVLGGGLMMLVGAAFFVWGASLHRKQRELLENPRRVRGLVEETWIRERPDDNGTTYYPEVRYSYEFEGETYESEGIYPGETKHGHGSRSKAQAALDDLDLREEARTTVFVDPDSPGGGFLRAETTTRSNLLFALGGLGLVCLGGLLVASHYGLIQ